MARKLLLYKNQQYLTQRMIYMEHLTILTGIFLINVVLSGDNAVVIALASRGLHPGQQRAAIFMGSAGAITLRILLTLAISFLLKIPYLQFVGGLLLVYIAIKLLKDDEKEEKYNAAGSLLEAIKVIIVADLIMSLDNTLAIAAVSRGDWLMLVIGLASSIPIIIFCSQLILYFMKKFPVIIYAGAGLIAWTAGRMMLEDKKIHLYLGGYLERGFDWLGQAVPLALTAIILLYGWRAKHRYSR
jgi:YjbE family integral membrane protein